MFISNHSPFVAYNKTYKIFEKPRELNSILHAFVKDLQTSESLSTIVVPSLGTTGATLLCEMPSHRVSLLNEDDAVFPIKFVLKWLSPEKAQNEKMCTDFFRHNGQKVPLMQTIPNKIAHQLGREAVRVKKSMTNFESLSLIAMPRFHAATFHDVVKNGSFFQLSANDQNRVFVAFGEISVYDLIIGNSDRLVRFSINTHGYLTPNPNMNSGNIMFEFQDGGSQAVLKEILIIDCATDSCLEPKAKITNDEEDCYLGLWSSDDEEQEDQTSHAEEIGSNSEKSPDPLLEMHTACITILSDFNVLVDHIIKSTLNSIYETCPERRGDFSADFTSLMYSGILEGLQLGMQKVKDFKTFPYEGTLGEFGKATDELIKMNLNGISESL